MLCMLYDRDGIALPHLEGRRRICGARLAYEQAQSLPIVWVHESPELLVAAAEIKANHRLSLADAWIAATALLRNGTLVHKDPEFSSLHIQQEALPFK